MICYYDSEEEHYVIHWCDEEGNYYRNYSRDLLELEYYRTKKRPTLCCRQYLQILKVLCPGM